MDWRLITSVLLLLFIGARTVHSTYTNEFVVNVEGGADVADILAQKYGFINGGEMENFPDHFVFYHQATQKRSIRPSTGEHTAIQHEKAVNWIEQQVIRKRVKRDTKWINDPKYRLQWYMSRKDAPNMNVEAAWEMGYTGQGVVVSILDDGIDHTHPDLVKNYDPLASTDINGVDDDPMPRSNIDQTNRHGTRCAGEVAMEAGNGVCGVGVAYNASIGGVRMLDDQVTDSVEGKSLAVNRNHIDIYSASWGPDDNGWTVDGPGRLAKQAFLDGVTLGRGGKGSIFVWASGNGGRARDSCGCDGYTNSIYTISVSSTSEKGLAPWYLEECASTLTTTYSSGSPKEKKVITTDLGGRCTDDHTGTSASAPLAAGLCALALQANPDLTWRDLQYIIVMTSRNASLQDSNWFTNGAGYAVSHRYGFGLMDAGAMVRLAKKWINLPEQRTCEIALGPGSRDIGGRGLLGSFTLNATACENGPNYLEHVQSTIDASFSSRGALVLTLISPSGTHSRLLGRRPRDKRRGDFSAWPFMSTHFWGENPQGVWTLQVENGFPKFNSGQLRSWVLTLYGTKTPPRSVKSPKPPAPHSDRVKDVGAAAKADANLPKGAIPRSSEYFGPCHRECLTDCDGPQASDCYKCLHYRDRITDECVEHCPEVGYYEPPDRHQKCKACSPQCRTCAGPLYFDCLSCHEGFFLLESLSECVEDCGDGFYADIDTQTCLQCAPLCSRCEESATHCLACKAHAVLTPEHFCQAGCSVNEYLDSDNTCRECYRECYTCSGGEENDCLSCFPGYVLKDRACIEDWKCTEGFYLRQSAGASTRECIQCHVSCKNCQGPSSSDCVECNGDHFLQDGACLTNCPDGYYMDDHGFCFSCSFGCHQCADLDNCITCESEYVMVDGYCEQGCGAGSYEREGHCVPCHALCATCIGSGPEDCTDCRPGENEVLYLLEGACVPFCPEGRYGDQETRQCEECDETCKTCNGSEINNCITCFEGFAFNDGACDERESLHCEAKCKTCVDGYEDRCSSCEDGTYLLREDCVQDCPGEYYTDNDRNECVHCNPSCKTCSGLSSQDCTSCHEEQFLYDDSTCDAHCPYTTYADSEDWTCKDCHRTCQSCSGPGPRSCETCEGNLFWEDNQCLETCPDGQYADWEEQQCMRCFPTCVTCSGPFSTDCDSCHDGFTLRYGSCETECPSRTYINDNGACEDCHETCLECKGPGLRDCLRCDYDRFLSHSNQCIEECIPGYYPDYGSNICRPCHSSCKTCVEAGPQDCMDCEEGMYFLAKQDGVYCVDGCPEGFYELEEGVAGDVSKTCQLCSSECLDCTESYSQCISCRDNTFLFRDQCVPNCPGGFVEDVESNRCIAEDRLCPLNCQNCNEWGECEVCDEGFERYYGECMRPPCNDGQYQALDMDGNRVCRECASHCTRCLGPRDDECLRCTRDYRLNNGHCSLDCDSKQFVKNGVCLACHPSCRKCKGASPYDCTACPEGTVHTDAGECSVGCPKGTYLNGGVCMTCHGSCLSCDGDGSHRCLSCQSGYYLTGDQACVETCPGGTYHYRAPEATDEFECRPCHSSCNDCYGPLSGECTSCHDNMYLLEHECVAHCGTGYFPGPNAVCQPCHEDCQSCWGETQEQCISCANSKKLVDTHCEDECPEDRYLSYDFGAVCEKCHARCKTCNDMGPFNCLSCRDGYELDDNVCYSRCDPKSYYLNGTDKCKPCSPACKECYGPADDNCLNCQDDQGLSKVDADHFSCVSCCKEGQDPDHDNCCNCYNGQCNGVVHAPPGPASKPHLNTGAIIFICFLIIAVFGLFFGLLQARSRKKLCWKNSYDQLPTFYNNTGKEPKITLRQNALPSSDDEDFFEDGDSDY